VSEGSCYGSRMPTTPRPRLRLLGGLIGALLAVADHVGVVLAVGLLLAALVALTFAGPPGRHQP
jgi:hypothetical protein